MWYIIWERYKINASNGILKYELPLYLVRAPLYFYTTCFPLAFYLYPTGSDLFLCPEPSNSEKKFLVPQTYSKILYLPWFRPWSLLTSEQLSTSFSSGGRRIRRYNPVTSKVQIRKFWLRWNLNPGHCACATPLATVNSFLLLYKIVFQYLVLW